ncbi:MAG TPA: energy transducer TonB [Bacteroidia bacterium]|nr:energy transducer TonB [Bacteroidia bacterium]
MIKFFKSLFIICLVSVFTLNAQVDKGIYQFNVDNFPEVYGGKTELKHFLHDHLVYPAEDLKNKKEGVVQLNFVVTKDGKTSNVTVFKSLTPATDKEAIRLLSLLDWIPSNKEGVATNVNFNLEVPFSISKYKKQVKERGFDTPLYIDIPTDSSTNIYETAERSPLFNNVDKTFTEFIYSNLEYPDVAARQNIEGKVQLSFIVEPDGMTSNIKVLNSGLAGGCNNEAIRVISLTKWQPAIRDGKYVRYRMGFTMNFSLKNNFKDNSNGTQKSWGQ